MPANRPTPAAAARAAVAAAANVTRGIEQALLNAAEQTKPSTDGRKQRWERHKAQRREQLVTGTIESIRVFGADVGMDEIAGHIGVSKTVLYRYFADKDDLTRAVSATFFQNELLPRLLEAIVDDRDEFVQVNAIVAAYVNTIASDPQVYRFVTSRAGAAAMDEPEAVVVKMITAMLSARLNERESDVGGAEIWAHAVVGATRHVVNWWTSDESSTWTTSELIDYLTMLLWSAVVGIAAFGGSRERFLASPPALPPVGSVSE